MANTTPPGGETSGLDWTARQDVPLAPPPTLYGGRFRLERVLGLGGMGEVRLAEDTMLHRKVAIKSVRADLCEDREVRQRIERECRLHATVGSHPNIVTLYDRFDEAGQIRLVMEYVDGESLQDKLRSGDVRRYLASLAEAVDITAQVLGALSQIHANGIVHRDIKPSNIMLCATERGRTVAKLMDFGIARRATDAVLGNITQTNYASPGTPLYMAPEQIDPEAFGAVSPATDVYAMGIVLYQMLSGAPPFSGTITEIFNAHLNSRPSFNFEGVQPVPDKFRSILRRALAKRPDDRYESAAAFREALLDAAQPEKPYRPVNVTRRPVPVLGTGRMRATRNRRRGGMVVAAAVALAMLGAWLPVTAYVITRDDDRSASRTTFVEPLELPTKPDETPTVSVPQQTRTLALLEAEPALPEPPLPLEIVESTAPAPTVTASVPLDTESFVIGEAKPPALSRSDGAVAVHRDVARVDSEIVHSLDPVPAPRQIQSEPLEPISAPMTMRDSPVEAAPNDAPPPTARVRAEPLPPLKSTAKYGFRIVGRESYRKD